MSKQASQPWRNFHADLGSLKARLLPSGQTALEFIKTDLIGQTAERQTGRMVEDLLAMCTLFIGDGPIDSWALPQFPEFWGSSLSEMDARLVVPLMFRGEKSKFWS
jgi:hypothetical protein